MATYYRWRRSTVKREPKHDIASTAVLLAEDDYEITQRTIYYSNSVELDGDNRLKLSGTIQSVTFHNYDADTKLTDLGVPSGNYYFAANETGNNANTVAYCNTSRTYADCVRSTSTGTNWSITSPTGSQYVYPVYITSVRDEFIDYVYSTSSSAYPNGGVQDGYYYDQRTTVTSPTAPSSIGFQAPSISTPTTTVQWGAATSNTDYPVNLYEVSVSGNGSSYSVVGTTSSTSMLVQVPTGTTMMYVRVRARDTNNQWGTYATSQAPVYLSPVLTVPQMVMQGQSATVSWTAISGADNYTLQRKSSADADWTQVYSGANLSYSETVGTWTSLQYRVQAVFDETPGGWATSDPIQIVSASALVISGQDGDLGTLVNDVLYSISSDQTSPTIDVTVEVNGGEYAAFQATSGQTYKVGVLDLPTGTGSIVITATTEVSSSPVTVTRTWTYSKTAQAFPNSGSVATLTKEGNVVYPETLTEAVRAAMNPWGGNLGTALNLLKNAALFNRTKQPKYSEVIISMANVTEGQIVNIPRGGVMVSHYIGKLEYESGLNGAGRRLLVPVESYENRPWDSDNVNAYATSDIDTWMNSTYKALFPEEIQTAMGTTEFYYTPGNGNNSVSTLDRALFLLSLTELGLSAANANVEGTSLPIANTLQTTTADGQWTRTPDKNSSAGNVSSYFVGINETVATGFTYRSIGTRPCFTLSSTFTGTYYVDQNGVIHDQQEYTEAGDWLDVWGNAIPAVKIATGSYVGTGTVGDSNPNTLTFPFEPKIVFVSSGSATIVHMIKGVPSANVVYGITAVYGINISSWSGNSVSWVYPATSYPERQLNASGTTYYYVAIG